MAGEAVKVTGQRVARRIRELRLERSLTLADLADRLAEIDRSYTLSTLSRIEQGKRRVDTDDLIALALALDVPPNAILFPPDADNEATTKLTATIESETSAVLRWARSGGTGAPPGLKASSGALALDPVPSPDARELAGTVHRIILAVDVDRATSRSDLAKGQVRPILYELIGRALDAAGIRPKHLEPFTDRGDGMLILMRPHDDVPKTLVVNQLMSILASLLAEYNASVAHPELRIRLRAVVHAGEIHEDGNGFYGEDLDAAFRLLEAQPLKKTLRETADASLILVISEEIYHGIVQQGYLGDSSYRPMVRVRVGQRQRRGWAHIPEPLAPNGPGANRWPRGQLPPRRSPA